MQQLARPWNCASDVRADAECSKIPTRESKRFVVHFAGPGPNRRPAEERVMARRTVVSLLIAIVCACAGAAGAQTYPDRLIKLVVGYPPGGPIDVTARLLVQRLAPLLGQTIIIETRPGAT